jgi:hypothetical protein
MLEAALFPRKLSFHLFNFVFYFMLDPDPEPETKAECITVPSPPRQKVAVTAIPAPQHCLLLTASGQPNSAPSYLNDLPSCVAVLGEVRLLPHLGHLHQLDLRALLSSLQDKPQDLFSSIFFSIGFRQRCGSGSSFSSESGSGYGSRD